MRSLLPAAFLTRKRPSAPQHRRKRLSISRAGGEQLESRQLLTISVSDVHLVHDTGALGADGVTSNPEVSITYSANGGESTHRFKIDLTGDLLQDVTYDPTTNPFTFDPLPTLLAIDKSTYQEFEGSYTLNYRGIEVNSQGQTIQPAMVFAPFTMTLDRKPPRLTELSGTLSDVRLTPAFPSNEMELGDVFNDLTTDANLKYEIILADGTAVSEVSNSLFSASIDPQTHQLTIQANELSDGGLGTLTIRARDLAGNQTGNESSPAYPDFVARVTVAPQNVLGDMDGDGDLDNFDIGPFELALTRSDQYLLDYPGLDDYQTRGDINAEDGFTNFDIQPFEALLTAGAPVGASAPTELTAAVAASSASAAPSVLSSSPDCATAALESSADNSAEQTAAARDVLFRSLAPAGDADVDHSGSLWGRRPSSRRAKLAVPSATL